MDRTPEGTIWRGNERGDTSENRRNWETCPRCYRRDRARTGSNGVLMTLFDARTRHWQSVVGEVRKHFGEKVFDPVFPRNTGLAEVPSIGKPIIRHDKSSAGAVAYRVLAEEVIKRLGLPAKP